MSGLKDRLILIAALAGPTALAQLIGVQRIEAGGFTIVLLPLIFAFLIGLAFNPDVTGFGRSWLKQTPAPKAEHIAYGARAVSVAVLPLIALLSPSIGPQLETLWSAGFALLLQELGNLGTFLLAMPVAVLGFRMGREAIGATFSIAREGGVAFIYSKYGGGTPEASGVLSVYIVGTFIGGVFFSLLPPLVASLGMLDLRALAMACGTGSASMTAACATSLGAAHPEDAEAIAAFAAASNLMTGLTGLFVTVALTIPLAEAYFRVLSRIRGGPA